MEIQSENNQLTQKKSTGKKIQRVITKTLLVTGTVGVIGYSMIKRKLLGNPPSKIRKGLLYATIAGVVLYKCQGEKVDEIYESASQKINTAYVEYCDIKKNSNEKIDSLILYNDSLLKLTDSLIQVNKLSFKNSENIDVVSEDTGEINNIDDVINEDINKNINKDIIKDLKFDSLNKELKRLNKEKLELLNEKNNLENKLEKEEKEYSSKLRNLEKNIIKNKTTGAKNNSSFENKKYENITSTLNNKKNIKSYNSLEDFVWAPDLELLKSENGQISFRVIRGEILEDQNRDVIWVLTDGKSSLNDIAKKYYGDVNVAKNLKEYNDVRFDESIVFNEGRPLKLIKQNILIKEGIYRGRLPKYLYVSKAFPLEHFLNMYCSNNKEKINLFQTLTKYNSLFDQNISDMKTRSETHRGIYCVLYPNSLKLK